jgi:hypothetical protein
LSAEKKIVGRRNVLIMTNSQLLAAISALNGGQVLTNCPPLSAKNSPKTPSSDTIPENSVLTAEKKSALNAGQCPKTPPLVGHLGGQLSARAVKNLFTTGSQHAHLPPDERILLAKSAAGALFNRPTEHRNRALAASAVSAASMTPEARSERGRKGGLAAGLKLTPEQRIARARKGGLASALSMTSAARQARSRKAGLARKKPRRVVVDVAPDQVLPTIPDPDWDTPAASPESDDFTI